MLKNRVIYFILIIITIALGLLSRQVDFLPLASGDALYAIMVYWGFRFIKSNKPPHYALLLSITFCFVIEFLQLLQLPFLIEARNQTILKLVLGQGFLWTDLIAYIIGGSTAYLFDKKFLFAEK
jgi:hypothetical protein